MYDLCLYHILLGLDMVKEKECSNEEFIKDLNELYDEIMMPKDSTTDLPDQRQYKMFHIHPGYSSNLGQALIESGTNEDEYIIAFQ
jgi:hypothetical protein